jgi:hypothetical protein
VPANELLGLGPGEVFVQRNVGNLATHKDMNVMSCMEYAVTGGSRMGLLVLLLLLFALSFWSAWWCFRVLFCSCWCFSCWFSAASFLVGAPVWALVWALRSRRGRRLRGKRTPVLHSGRGRFMVACFSVAAGGLADSWQLHCGPGISCPRRQRSQPPRPPPHHHHHHPHSHTHTVPSAQPPPPAAACPCSAQGEAHHRVRALRVRRRQGSPHAALQDPR